MPSSSKKVEEKDEEKTFFVLDLKSIREPLPSSSKNVEEKDEENTFFSISEKS